MLKIFLVEDEFVVREGIKNNIDWKAHGYDFCGEAGDGEQAFPMIQKLKPDIVITDIKMPFMDGLALSKLIKKELPWTEIIILSGYAEFEYAKQGIKIGVAEYISKPISGEELIKEVDIVAKRIEEAMKEREIRAKYRKEMEENFLSERKNLFHDLVTARKSVPELLEAADKLSVDLSALWYSIVLLKVESLHHARDEYSGRRLEIDEQLKELNDEMHILAFDRNLEGSALIFKSESRDEMKQLLESYICRFQEILAKYDNFRYFAGIGIPVNRIGELQESFEKASHAFAHRYIMPVNRFLDSEEIRDVKYLGYEEFNIGEVDTKQINRNRISEFLKFGDRGEAVYFVEEFFRGVGEDALKSNLFRQYLAMDTFFCVAEFVEGMQFSRAEIPQPDVTADVLKVKDEESTMKYIVSVIEKALELRDTAASNRYRDIVEEAMHYIEQNYADEELSLNLLASHVNFSPNHLSMVFSQETGQTFIKYLTDYRMNKAKELLRCSGKRSSVIASEVGYKDPHYFSFLFKKTQGMTPTQYRGVKGGEGED